jgi:hypothetical protein
MLVLKYTANFKQQLLSSNRFLKIKRGAMVYRSSRFNGDQIIKNY